MRRHQHVGGAYFSIYATEQTNGAEVVGSVVLCSFPRKAAVCYINSLADQMRTVDPSTLVFQRKPAVFFMCPMQLSVVGVLAPSARTMAVHGVVRTVGLQGNQLVLCGYWTVCVQLDDDVADGQQRGVFM